ncbi:hypothetical protein KFE98_08225 [bacterium SCSIO 12741]|nr:hypothetical protein KFE98_08225 [bacterium SCSIO 12741]
MKRIIPWIALALSPILLAACSTLQSPTFSKQKVTVQVNGKAKQGIQWRVESQVPTSADSLIQEMHVLSFWTAMLRPKVILQPTSDPIWIKPGRTDTFKLTVNRIIPFGKHMIYWESFDPKLGTLQTREYGGYVKVWDNQIQIKSLNDSTSILSDQLVLHGGVLTGLTALWAKGVLRRRHQNMTTYFKIKSSIK